MATQSAALAPSFLPSEGTSRLIRQAGLVVLGTVLMTVAAKTQVPFFPVPQTLQTLAVFAIAAAYGRNLAVITMLAYLAQGLMGWPVFSGAAAGPAYMAGPTGGYLVGFVVAAAIVGAAADRGLSKRPFAMFGTMLVADIIVFVLGFFWLSTLIGASKALEFGVVPFVLGDLVKIALASAVIAAVWKLLRRA
ncbi:MAG: biotin transporter BioY [Pseudomonadota bacterium]